MVLEEERRREGIDSMILEAVTGPPEQVAPCIRNALEVRRQGDGYVYGVDPLQNQPDIQN